MRSLLAALLLLPALSFAQYNAAAGSNAPTVRAAESYYDDSLGKTVTREVERPAPKDSFGNANGNTFDLAVDGAFEGQTVAVLHFYTGEGFDFSLPKAALKEKGFSVYRWMNKAPPAKELEAKLKEASQLWIISSSSNELTPEHVKVIKRFFDSGKGVYIWGDNEPYYTDANVVARALLDTEMKGNLMGDKVVGMQKDGAGTGVRKGHLLTTGLEFIYEGITIATIQPNQNLTPLIHGSEGNLVAAVYEKDGKRAILDGGFTRLFLKWDTAGTGRYVKNAAAWLANAERFGDKVVAKKVTGSKTSAQ